MTPVKSGKSGLGVQLGTAGVAACIADLFTFPLDTTKVKYIQIFGLFYHYSGTNGASFFLLFRICQFAKGYSMKLSLK